ncbi:MULTISPECIES: glycosyltransferase [unclassified Oceanispirochaeta]|uniref:capsular polysaccharide export protein, LipB/KpsS family n=1 Tax=unclassified Oceanispirochaeta TaxID=2635722 RepID=UPI000E09B8A2|nr:MULTISPECIES: glycosyltransferase [unclassified Oceanispirochaeta]MBF9014416.1 glycosyltransferase [Oceanispirochaeta sp. M2]NPD71302.1 glycosyltransferase [Oceanispirochaeta sp. M1]RDG33682.1 glycosyltransferase [Oceanispirochaeta sp. M1]
MNINSKISVIIPVFNVEKYVENALNSLFNQSYDKLEIIIINDGSTDNSLNIINEVTVGFPNCNIITTKNSGYGKACNVGLKIATGDYISIFEPDDILFNDFYIKLINIAIETNVDIVKYNGLYTYESISLTNRGHYISSEYCDRLIQAPDILLDLWKKHPAVFNGIYKREWIEKNNIRFVETPSASYQDAQFLISQYYSVNSMYIIDETQYYYRQHENQSVADADNKIVAIIAGWNLQMDWMIVQENKDTSFFIFSSFRQMLTLVERRLNKNINKLLLMQGFKILRKRIKKEKLQYNLKYFSRREYRIYMVLIMNPILFLLLFPIFKAKRIGIEHLSNNFSKISNRVKSFTIRLIKKKLVNFINEYKSLRNLSFETQFKRNTEQILTISYIWDGLINKSKYPLIRLSDMNSFSVFFKSGRLISVFSDEFERRLQKTDLLLFWGLFRDKKVLSMLDEAVMRNIPHLFLEDGFIRSITPTPDKKYPSCYKQSLSLSADFKTTSFDVTRPSMLEDLLNSEKYLSEQEIHRAKFLIEKIISNHLTKYNHQPIITPVIGRNEKKKILVVDQAYNDWSIIKGAANDNTFKIMLNIAILENPDSDIIIKVHPDMIADNSRGGSNTTGYYGNILANESLFICSENINPISMINYVDKVYVCSSQMGFEALMCNKDVVIFGAPFYAGWGVGDVRNDSPHLQRRIKKRSVEEIFYFMYLEYTRYINPELMQECQLEEFLDIMIKNRNDFFIKYNIS